MTAVSTDPHTPPERLDAVTRRVVKQAAKAKRRRDPKQLDLPFSERNDDGQESPEKEVTPASTAAA